MRRLVVLSLVIIARMPVWAQTIQTDGDIETGGQLVSTVATGTAPLAVSSTTVVQNLNAERLNGFGSFDFALYNDLLVVYSLLDNPDPPCFSNTLRFVDCGNGTVTDTVTGMIWLKDADCFPALNYAAANATAAALFDGSTNDPLGGDCALTDGSRLGDWRLPTEAEWEGIAESSCTSPPKIAGNASPTLDCYSVTPWATDVQSSSFYWSAETASAADQGSAMVMAAGGVGGSFKTSNLLVWPVRGGQK